MIHLHKLLPAKWVSIIYYHKTVKITTKTCSRKGAKPPGKNEPTMHFFATWRLGVKNFSCLIFCVFGG
jgi:hypothetical protein